MKQILLILLLAPLAWAQSGTTVVTAQIKDSNNSLYVNCQWSVIFVHQNTSPGVGPDAPAALLNGQQGNCDSFGNLTVNLADNVNTVTPTPSQWNFSICSGPGYTAGPFCHANMLVTITGTSQNLTSFFQPLMPLLPPTSGGGGSLPTATLGKVLASQGINVNPVFQTKTNVDIRDFNFVCDGVTSNTTAAQNLIAAAGTTKLSVVGFETSGDCGVGDLVWPANLTLDFSTGWRLKTLTDSTTSPGAASFDTTSGSAGQCQSDNAFSVCNITVTAPANDTYVIACMRGFSSGAGVFSSNVGSDAIIPLNGSSISFASITQGALIPNVVGGSHTFTVTFPNSLNGACSALPITGLGPTPYLDGAGGTCSNVQATTPMSCSGTFQSGSFLLAWGGQHFTAQTCTAGAGFTQPAGAVGNSTNVAVLCNEYQNSATAGSTTASQSFSSSPAGGFWSYQIIGLRPSSAVNIILGSVNDPTGQQVFTNATGSAGIIDFTGNNTPIAIQPEWWGACGTCSSSANTAALEAAIRGAFGQQNRINGSGLNQYNKELLLTQQYQINGELQFYHVIGAASSRWEVYCRPGAGITQTTSNDRILDGQSDAYGRFDNCQWTGSTSSTKPLIDLDFDGTHGTDLAPQFIDFYSNSFNGSSVVDTGLLIAKTGGSAQGSNIYCFDCAGIGFTGAVWQAGGNNTGRNVGRFNATNALAIGWYGGDMQGCPNAGWASYGAGFVYFHGTSFECVSPWGGALTSVVGEVDVDCETAQGPCIMDHVRSEDLRLMTATHPRINDSSNTDQSTAFFTPSTCLAGSSEPLNSFIHGSDIGSDGAIYQITVHGTAFSGVCLFNASSGTSTTITDTNQLVPGSVTIGTPSPTGETMTQATSGSTGTLLNVPASIGTITGSVTSGTIGATHTMTQASTSVTCTSQNAPTGSQSLTCNNFSGTADNSHAWTDGTTSGVYTPTAAPSFSVASPEMIITAATGTPDGTHDWVGGTSGFHLTPTGVPVNQVSFPSISTSTGAQSQVTFWGGTGFGQICYPITSNTTTQITFTQCTTNYANVHSANADTTTTAIVEPCWQCANITTIGDFTVAKQNPVIIGGGPDEPSSGSSDCYLQNVTANGGIITCGGSGGQFTTIKNLTVTRADWYGPTSPSPGANISTSLLPQILEQVQVQRSFGSAPTGQSPGIIWSIAGRNSNTNIFSGPLQNQFGTSPIVFSQAANNGGTGANDTWIGGRSDRLAGTDTFRNRVEYSGMLGASAPNGFNITNQNGTGTFIGGGSSTGSGTPGDIEFWIGTSGSSGTTVNSGVKKAGVDSSGLLASFDGSVGTEYGQAAGACETSFGITTLSLVGATTDTGLSCLPANAVIDAVLYRITTTITTAANFTIGDSSTANRFCTTQSTLTAGTTGVCFAQSGTSAQQQASAAKVRVTANTTPGAGAIRLIVYYHTWVAPTS